MNSGTVPLDGAMPSPTFHPLPRLGRPIAMDSAPRRDQSAGGSRLPRVGMRWAAVAATVALLLATAGGGYLASRDPGESGRATSIAGFVASPVVTPSSEYVDPCAAFEPYVPCGVEDTLAVAYVAGSLYDAALTDGIDQVELQSWSIGSGMTVRIPEAPAQISAIGVDVVISGSYTATFTDTVTVSRTRPSGVITYDYPNAGALVELDRGDAVSYPIRSRIVIANTLTSRPLEFKSIVLESKEVALGDSSMPDAAYPVEGAYELMVDGHGTLPQPLSDYGNREMTIFLTYTEILPNVPFPPEGTDRYVLGPVDSAPALNEDAGYVVWAFPALG